jgi:hypothetical protein
VAGDFHKHVEHITEISRKMIYRLGKTAKLNWGLGHKSLKTIYEGAVGPLMTYGAPVWEEAVTKRRLLRKLQGTQRLINIKIAKAYRTISFEASCLMAGVQPIGTEIEGETCLYKRKHSTGKDEYEWDKPLPVKEWPHPAWRAAIMGTSDLITYPTEIFTDVSKIGDKVGAGLAIYSDKNLVRKYKYRLQNHCSNNQAEQIAILKALEQLPSLPDQTNTIVAIDTDSRVTLDSLKNNTIHNFLIEETRKMILNLSKKKTGRFTSDG